MGLSHSLRVLHELVQISIPCAIEIHRGRITRENVDARARHFGRRVVDILEVDLQVSGGESLSDTQPYVYLSNHQSNLDIPMLYASLPSRTIRMVGKKELFVLPIWGSGLRACEFVDIDRSDTDGSRESVLRAAALMRRGVSFWLAPEGTRSHDGSIGRLRKGGIRLARLAGAPIVPVAVRGTVDIMPRGRLSSALGKTVHVRIGEPIDVRDRRAPELLAEVRSFFVRHVEAETSAFDADAPPRPALDARNAITIA